MDVVEVVYLEIAFAQQLEAVAKRTGILNEATDRFEERLRASTAAVDRR